MRDVTEYQRHFYSMYFTSIDEIDEIYFGRNSKRVISAMGIDENFDISINEIKKAFKRAKINNEIIILYAHKPVENINATYQISFQFIESLLNIADEVGLVSYIFSDLSNFINK